MLLCGDLGGTKTTLAVFASETELRAPVAESTFSSGRYPSFAELARAFLERVRLPVTRASFGVAGPVVDGRATITNLPWVVDTRELSRTLNLSSVRLLNDLEAVATAVPHLTPDDLCTLNPGKPERSGAVAVIAPGTGLGEAFLTWDGARYRAHASEGGHADFAPADARQAGLLRFLQERYEHVSYERVCSGSGIPHLYAYLRDSGCGPEPGWLTVRLAEAVHPTPVIIEAALDRERPCPLCAATLDLFVEILAAEAGNLALKVLATGGVYLGGGIPPRVLSVLTSERFMAAFLRKGRFAGLLTHMPVHVIRNPKAALLGAAYAGLCDA